MRHGLGGWIRGARRAAIATAAVLALAVAGADRARGDGVGDERLPTPAPEVGAQPLVRRAPSWACCPVPEACPCPTTCLPDPLLRVPCLDDCLDAWKEAKEGACFRLGAGAYHWWHLRSEDDEFTYGYPGAEGTYFYYVTADLDCPTRGCWSVGAHAHVRFRDDTEFRSFFDEKVWLYEGYLRVASPVAGTFKAGKVWKRFGIDWDGSFWGNVAYYNGYKLDPDWGVSWEHALEWTRLSVPLFAQLFVAEDEVNGSIEGGDSESSSLVDEELTLVARAVPTWRIDSNSTVALGLSGLWGRLDAPSDLDSTRWALAADLSFTWCGFKVYGEAIWARGAVHEAHYASGGPSDRKAIYQLGAQYRYGPLTGRLAWSFGDYEGPDAEEDILLLGLDVALTRWLTLTVEWQDWDVKPAGGPTSAFEEGWSFVLAWNL